MSRGGKEKAGENAVTTREFSWEHEARESMGGEISDRQREGGGAGNGAMENLARADKSHRGL